MSKYIYDIRSGHYKLNVLNEANNNAPTPDQALNNATNNPQDQTNNSQNSQQAQPTAEPVKSSVGYSNPKTEDDMYVNLTNQIALENKNYTTQKTALENQLRMTQRQVASQVSSGSYTQNLKWDPTIVSPEVLNIEKRIFTLDRQHSLKVFNFQQQQLDRLAKMSTETVAESLGVPSKYLQLNESNLKNAKIYLHDLIANDDYHILKNMNDLKRLLKDTNLLCGKDKHGYFVICIDQDDFDEIQGKLQEVGYEDDEIIDNLMPQLFDRRELV